MSIDSSALGDGRSWGMLFRSPHGKRVAWKTGQPFQARLPVNADWTGQIMCPLEKFWWGESDLDSPLARLACLVRNAGGWYGTVGLHPSEWIHDR